MNLGQVTSNSFKESDAVGIAKSVIEENRNIKTYFSENDKRANLDGQLTIIRLGYERITVDVQIKTLPEYYAEDSSGFFYDCDTKVFNVVKVKVTQNPVVLILVDIVEEKVFTFLITMALVHKLGIENQKTKRIRFNDSNLFKEEVFLDEIYRYVRIIESNNELEVKCEAIRSILVKRNKPLMADYQLVYTNNEIEGYLTSYYHIGSEKKINVILLKMVSKGKDEVIQVRLGSEIIQAHRSNPRTSATDSDVINILYEFVFIYNKPLFYKNADIPMFYIDNEGGGILRKDVWSLKAERIEKEW